MQRHRAILALLSCILFSPQNANSQSLEERIHDVFITAGYSTVIGACAGATMASMAEESTSNFRLIAAGASIGFFGGTLFGSYVVFSPLIAQNPQKEHMNFSTGAIDPKISQSTRLVLSPHISIDSQKISSITGRYIFWTF